MMFWLMVMLFANAGALAIANAIKQIDLLLGHTVGVVLILAITLVCVDRMAREMK